MLQQFNLLTFVQQRKSTGDLWWTVALIFFTLSNKVVGPKMVLEKNPVADNTF